jgi:hypothetical protein
LVTLAVVDDINHDKVAFPSVKTGAPVGSGLECGEGIRLGTAVVACKPIRPSPK